MTETTSWPVVSAVNMDAVRGFLPVLEAEGFSAGEFVSEPGTLPFYDFNPHVMALVKALYDNNWIVPSFDWVDWHEGNHYLNDEKALPDVDVRTLQKLFTLIVRQDRFCEGSLGSVVDGGLVTAILRRVRELQDSEHERGQSGEGAGDGQ
ncbi:MAG: hypothetical protein GWP08_18155 [Nitrospiraceae bacterium]|nr:hypothetical protein [Nitrospiraceae bacterium]